MSINGIDRQAGGISPLLQRQVKPGEERRPAVAADATGLAAKAQVDVDANEALGAQAPPGTDPALWSVLTAEERVFFSRMQSMGTLTYGPGRKSAPPTVTRGGRIDLTV